MQDYGYPFCISGIDALIGKMQHVPEQYPVIMVVEKKSMPQIRNAIGVRPTQLTERYLYE
jgi:hypothetical protein